MLQMSYSHQLTVVLIRCDWTNGVSFLFFCYNFFNHSSFISLNLGHFMLRYQLYTTSSYCICYPNISLTNLQYFFFYNLFSPSFYTYLLQDLGVLYFVLLASSGMKTLTVKSPLSVPYLFFTRMLYLPESDVWTVVMVKLANLPDSNFRM